MWKVMLMRNDSKKTRHQQLTALWEHLEGKWEESVMKAFYPKSCSEFISQVNLWRTHLPLSRPTPQTRIVWIGCVFKTVKFSGSISFKAPSSKSKNKSLPYKSICDMISFETPGIASTQLTSPHRPMLSSKSFLPNDKSRMHLFTAFDERSGVRSSSAISTHPRDLTANLMGLSVSDFNG